MSATTAAPPEWHATKKPSEKRSSGAAEAAPRPPSAGKGEKRQAWLADPIRSERRANSMDYVQEFPSECDVLAAADNDINAETERPEDDRKRTAPVIGARPQHASNAVEPGTASIPHPSSEWADESTDDSDDTSSSTEDEPAHTSHLDGNHSAGAVGRLAAARLRCAVLEQQAALAWTGPPPLRSEQKKRIRTAEGEVQGLRRRLAALDNASDPGPPRTPEEVGAGGRGSGRSVSPELSPRRPSGQTASWRAADTAKRPIPGSIDD